MDHSQTMSNFQWISPLGICAILFLISGAIHILIGSLTPWAVNSQPGKNILIISKRTDAELFGKEPSEILAQNPELDRFRSIFFSNSGGALVIIGIFIISLTWFGIRQQQPWAYYTLVLTSITILPFWYQTFKPYLQAGISFRFSDLPPIFWIPTVILLPAIILGWFGIKSVM